MATTDYTLERGLPSSIDAERSILGAILLDNFAFHQASSQSLQAEDFSLDSHRRIYGRMRELGDQGRAIDLITLAEELSRNRKSRPSVALLICRRSLMACRTGRTLSSTFASSRTSHCCAG